MDREITREYESLRRRAEYAASRRREEVYAQCPEIEKLARVRRDAAFHLAFEPLNGAGKAEAVIEARREIERMREREAALLSDLGLPADYMEPKYRCSKCRDTGYTGYPVKRPCECLRQKIRQKKYASSRIDCGESFDSFDPEVFPTAKQRAGMLRVRGLLEDYANAFPNTSIPNLLLTGKTGLGKTFLLNCVAKCVSDRGYGVMKITAYNLVNEAVNAIRANEPPEHYNDAELLVIDDLGSEPMMRNLTREQIFTIINEREASGRHTLVATNLSLQELSQTYGERIFSRIVSPRFWRVIPLYGEDIRVRGNLNKSPISS